MPEQQQQHPAVLFILDHLPDSISLRKQLLEDCLVLLPENDPFALKVSQLHDLLVLHEQMQRELPLDLLTRSQEVNP